MYHGERFNSISHTVGAALAAIGGIFLIVVAARTGDPWKIVSCSVYAAMLLTLYLTSTLYHSVRGKAKAVLQRLDHCAIYLLIAGTYTPFTLIGLRGPWGWGLFTAIWTLAIAGVIFKLFYTGRFKVLSTAIYIAMGWLVIVAVKPLLNAVDPVTLGWMLAGGLFYTLGTFFYHRESIRYSHAIWHLFVLGGSVCHFVAVTQQILMPRLAS